MRKRVVEELVKELYGLGTVRRELARHALAELGTQGFTALAAVHVHGPIRVSEVASRLSVDLSVASRQLRALARAGYVTSEPDGEDRRALLLTTTDAGRRALQESHRRMVHVFGDALDGWTEAEVAALSAALARLSADFASAPGAARQAASPEA
jgi:DNA-binding MarR family transcriptional regulator